MGITIHFEGRVRDSSCFQQMLTVASEYASANGWLSEAIQSDRTNRIRVDEKEQDVEYAGPVSGIVVYPHGDCDPVRLEFDSEFYVQEFTKTQFAGVQSHIKVVGLLKAIEPFFEKLKVIDEGEYWETGDTTVLENHLRACDHAIQEELRAHPGAEAKVRTPDGRIMDLMTDE